MSPMGFVPDRGDVIYLKLDPQAGHEQGGERPVVTLSPAEYNRKTGRGFFCPITNQKKGYPFEIAVPVGGRVTGVILADHMKNLDWRARKARPFDRMDSEVLASIIRLILPVIDPENEFGTDELTDD